MESLPVAVYLCLGSMVLTLVSLFLIPWRGKLALLIASHMLVGFSLTLSQNWWIWLPVVVQAGFLLSVWRWQPQPLKQLRKGRGRWLLVAVMALIGLSLWSWVPAARPDPETGLQAISVSSWPTGFSRDGLVFLVGLNVLAGGFWLWWEWRMRQS
jgi:hypothetical protein